MIVGAHATPNCAAELPLIKINISSGMIRLGSTSRSTDRQLMKIGRFAVELVNIAASVPPRLVEKNFLLVNSSKRQLPVKCLFTRNQNTWYAKFGTKSIGQGRRGGENFERNVRDTRHF
jgi:hypothetical protein